MQKLSPRFKYHQLVGLLPSRTPFSTISVPIDDNFSAREVTMPMLTSSPNRTTAMMFNNAIPFERDSNIASNTICTSYLGPLVDSGVSHCIIAAVDFVSLSSILQPKWIDK